MRLVKQLLISLVLISSSVFADTLADFENRKWEKITDKGGIQVYRSHNENSRFKTFKGVTVMPIENIFAFLALMEDYESAPSWLHMVRSVSAVERPSDSERVVYTQTGLPWPVKDRDIYTNVVITQTDDYGLHMMYENSPNPRPDVDGYQRIKTAFGYMSVVPIENTENVVVTYSAMIDPDGFIPAWIINLITGDVAYFTVKRMVKMLSMEKYQEAQYPGFERRPWITAPEIAETSN